MKDVEIELIRNYAGPASSLLLDSKKGVKVFFNPWSGIPFKFTFSADKKWTKEQAEKYIENRDLAKSSFVSERNLSNGIRLAASPCNIELVKSDEEISQVKEILGDKIYSNLMALEEKYGNDKPFIVKMIAMDFKGKDTVIGNSQNGKFRFHRKGTIENLDSFQGIPMFLGHANFLQSFQKRVANTVKSFEDENGNPAVYSYIYPHDEAGSLREDLRIAEAQGQLNTYELSCTGDPVDYEVIDAKHKDFGRVDVDVKTWRAESLDFVDKGAVSGSQLDSIVNSSDQNFDWMTFTTTGGNNLEITLSDAFSLLNEKKIVLSELLEHVPNLKEVIEKQIELAKESYRKELLADAEFIKEAVGKADTNVLLSCDNVKKFIDDKFDERLTNYDAAVESIDKLAKANGIELNAAQLEIVKGNLRGDETDQQKIELMQAASKFSNIRKGIDGIFESKTEKDGPVVTMGASYKEVSAGDVKVEI